MFNIKKATLIGFGLLFVCHLSYSQEETEEVEPKEPTNSPQEDTTTYSERLSSYYEKDAVIWIDEEQKSVFLVRSDNIHKITYGNLLLISEREERPLSLGLNNVLDKELTKLGWNLFHAYIPGSSSNNSNSANLTKDDESSPTNTEQNNLTEQTETSTQDYSEQIVNAIQLIRNSNNDEVFVLVKGFSSDTILRILAEQLTQIDGVIFLLPQIVTFDSNRRQKLASLSLPQYIFYSKHKINNQATEQWLNFLNRTQHQQTTIDKSLKVNATFDDGSFYPFRIHRWLKNLTFKNPN